jgi:hypothetical protein
MRRSPPVLAPVDGRDDDVRRSWGTGSTVRGIWLRSRGGQCDSGGLAEHAPATSVRPRDSCFSVGSTRMTRPRRAGDGFCLHGLLVSHSDTAGDEVGSRSKFPAHLTKTSTTAARLQNTHGPTFDRSEPPFNSWAPGTGWIGSGSSVSKIILEGVHVATFPDIFVFYTTILERKKIKHIDGAACLEINHGPIYIDRCEAPPGCCGSPPPRARCYSRSHRMHAAFWSNGREKPATHRWNETSTSVAARRRR